MSDAVEAGGGRGDERSDGARDSHGDGDTPLQSVAAGAVTFLTLGVAFGLLALDVSYFWVAFPVGFGGGMPLAVGLARWYEAKSDADDERSPRGTSDTDAALADLRERYARGELDDEEFETRVERLLETESVADAAEFAERRARTGEDSGGGEDGASSGDGEDGGSSGDGEDGASSGDGEDGADGKDSEDGTDGKDSEDGADDDAADRAVEDERA